MNAIVTVIGKDKVGIIAAVCIKLAEMNVNVHGHGSGCRQCQRGL